LVFFGACFGAADFWCFRGEVASFPLLAHPGHKNSYKNENYREMKI
jgi:hypothetical protein